MSIYSKLHDQLSIPDNYYLGEVQAPKLDPADRKAALVALVGTGELSAADSLLSALVRKLTKLKAPALKDDTDKQADRPKGKKVYFPAPFFAEKEAVRIAKKQQIVEALLANPKASATELGRQYGVNESTARNYRRQLKAEGKLP